jgi:hypothetical protein
VPTKPANIRSKRDQKKKNKLDQVNPFRGKKDGPMPSPMAPKGKPGAKKDTGTKKFGKGKGGGADSSRTTVLRKKPKLGTKKHAPGKGGGSDASRKTTNKKKKPTIIAV